MVIRLIHEWPYPFAGAVIISATQPDAANFLAASKDSRETSLPILLIHGTSDPIVPYKGGVASLWGFNPYKKAPFLFGKTATNVNSADLLWDFFQQQNPS
jgi:poly(3-hydroxybutyrate) depolymerase